MGRNMGIDFGNKVCKRKNRWLFNIGDDRDSQVIIGDGVSTLPPLKTTRPTLSFKEMSVQHVNEEVFYPAKPDWKPFHITIYDLKDGPTHKVFEWVKSIYDPQQNSRWTAPVGNFIKPFAVLTLFDGCGEAIETWKYESVWPQTIDFQDLDMNSSEYVTCDLTIRYARAYIESSERQPV